VTIISGSFWHSIKSVTKGAFNLNKRGGRGRGKTKKPSTAFGLKKVGGSNKGKILPITRREGKTRDPKTKNLHVSGYLIKGGKRGFLQKRVVLVLQGKRPEAACKS